MHSIVSLLAAAVARRPHHIAVEDLPAGALSYADLDLLSDAVRDRLRQLGVRAGDRVGIYGRKSIDTYAAMLGAMKCGAAYVPVDYAAPAWRAAFILNDCSVAAVVLESTLTEAWREQAVKLGSVPPALELEQVGGGVALRAALARLDVIDPAPSRPSATPAPDDLAYILYTSGSTGKPKGVMLSHRNAVSYVNWCSTVFAPDENDRFSSHAPFHFDLSILDLYVPLKHAATVVLIGAETGKSPQALAALIAQRRLTIWYSTPTILTLLVQFGKMERHDFSPLRYVFFAGEVFPVKHLRAVKQRLPHARFFNLYGPTETNVCTWYPIPDDIPADRVDPYPIGKVCSHFRARVVDARGLDVTQGDEGELVMSGEGTMQGYWNMAERTAQAFLTDAGGTRWYRTGDLVREGEGGVFTYVGRRDRMVKRRGYRVELGEIEAGLYRHDAVKEAAVVSSTGIDGDVRITAFVCISTGHVPSVVEMKRFCATVLPDYMVPDVFVFPESVPKTSTDKTDYQRLLQIS